MEPILEIPPFKLGDIVQLASGGPDMRVIGFSPNGNVWCDWQGTFLGRRDEASFVPQGLVHVTDSSDAGTNSPC